MYGNSKISVRQFTMLIILGIIGDSILIVPTMIASSSKQDAWISMLIAIALGIMTATLFAGIANQLQRKGLIETAQQRFGLWLGSFIGLLFLINFFMCGLTLIIETSQFLRIQLMPETPKNAISLFFLAVVIVAYRYGAEAFGRMSELLFPVLAFLFLALLLLAIPQIHMDNIQPILSQGTMKLFQGALPAYATSFTEMITLLMLVPHVAGNQKLTKPIMVGFISGGLILFVIVFFCIIVVGPNIMVTKYYPTFVLAQKISIGHFLERLEATVAFMWITTIFYKMLIIFYSLTAGTAQLLRLKEGRMLTIPLAILLLVFSVPSIPNVIVYNYEELKYYMYFDLTFCVALPVLVLLLMAFTNVGKGESAAAK